MKNSKDLQKIKGDASFRTFYRSKKNNSIVVYAKKEKTLKILDQILKGETPKPGSYRGRINNEPENNRKTLMDYKNA